MHAEESIIKDFLFWSLGRHEVTTTRGGHIEALLRNGVWHDPLTLLIPKANHDT